MINNQKGKFLLIVANPGCLEMENELIVQGIWNFMHVFYMYIPLPATSFWCLNLWTLAFLYTGETNKNMITEK